MELTVNVGAQGVALADGTDVQARAGRTGDMIVSELHGRYFEQMRAGRMFSAANQAATTTSAALATGYLGLLVYNPVGSNKILVPNKVKLALAAAPAAWSIIGLLGGFAATGGVTAQTTPLTVQSNQIGNSSKGVGIALASATIVTPTVIFTLSDGITAAGIPAASLPYDLEGVFGILPGGFIGIYTQTATSSISGMSWEEVDLPL